MNPFKDKVAIVTGGGSGIGRAISVYLGRQGAKVIVADLNLDIAQETVSCIRSNQGFAMAMRVDVSQFHEVEAMMNNVVTIHGPIDYLFNNAGVSINGEFQDIPLEEWKRIMGVNLWGVVYGCHHAYPVMQKQGFGHIINTASLAGLIPGGLTSAYSASKHAVVGFTLTLRGEAKQYGVKISALCPGYIRTNIQKSTKNLSAFMDSEKSKKMEMNMKFKTAEECVRQIMRGVRKNKAIIISPGSHRIYWWLYRLAPPFMPIMWNEIIKHMKKVAFTNSEETKI